MSNPIAIFEDLREMYLRYLDSPFDLRYPDLIAERRALLNVDGRLFRQPLIEPIPAYQSSNRTFQAIAQAQLGNSWSQGEVADLADFVSLEVFPPDRLPYAHQEQVFTESVFNGHDVVVTTGTGSGKKILQCVLRQCVPSSSIRLMHWSRISTDGCGPRWTETMSATGCRQGVPETASTSAATRDAHPYQGTAMLQRQASSEKSSD